VALILNPTISYIYLLDEKKTLVGVFDLGEIALAAEPVLLGDLTVSPVVSTLSDDRRQDLAELFARYQFHMIPVVDEHDRLLGVIPSRDIMKELVRI
jgi:magnesium transporter